MFQNKKLKRNATYAIAEVAEVALCASNCALPTSAKFRYTYVFGRVEAGGRRYPLTRMQAAVDDVGWLVQPSTADLLQH